MAESNHFELLIGGADTPASGGGRLEARSPATGEVVGSVADGTAADADRAVAAAAGAFATWSALTAYEREKAIKAALAHVRSRADELGSPRRGDTRDPLALGLPRATVKRRDFPRTVDAAECVRNSGVPDNTLLDAPRCSSFRSL